MIKLLFLASISLLAISCASSTFLTVRTPPMKPLPVSSIAIAPFQVIQVKHTNLIEKQGEWSKKNIVISAKDKEEIAKQVRGYVVQELENTPNLHLFYSDRLEELNKDAQVANFISAAGIKEKKFDAVLQGRIWIESEKISGEDVNKDTVAFKRVYHKNMRADGKKVLDFTVDKVAWWPYKSINLTLTIELSVIHLSPMKVITSFTQSKTFSSWIGTTPLSSKEQAIALNNNYIKVKKYFSAIDENQDQVLKKFLIRSNQVLLTREEALSVVARELAQSFASKVAYGLQRKEIPLDTSGETTSILLIRNGAYQSAIERLQKLINTKKTKEDIYNLAVCFEATANYSLAKTFYKEAFYMDTSNRLYAQGIARMEKLFRIYKNLGSVAEQRVR